MAKNLLEQFLDFATSKLTGPIGDDIYIKETPELTGVAKYLAKQEQAAQETAAASGALTGVEKYLARQGQTTQAKEPSPAAEKTVTQQAAAAPLSGVAKYLAREDDKHVVTETKSEVASVQEDVAPLSRVARYLASQAKSSQPSAEPAKPIQEPSAPLSRVARYLASQEKTAQPAEEPPVSVQENAAPVSRVARYLAGQEKAAQPTAATVAPTEPVAQEISAPLSRVAKYLASQEAALKPAAVESATASAEAAGQEDVAPLSRVAKYLAATIGKEFKPNVSEPASGAEPASAPVAKTGVAKYLASNESAKGQAVPAVATAPVSRVSKYLASQDVAGIVLDDNIVENPETKRVKTSAEVIRLDDGLQCQASTVKGTQCRNKTNLGHLQKTVNNQIYQFSVCNQHNNDSFKPFASVLDS